MGKSSEKNVSVPDQRRRLLVYFPLNSLASELPEIVSHGSRLGSVRSSVSYYTIKRGDEGSIELYSNITRVVSSVPS